MQFLNINADSFDFYQNNLVSAEASCTSALMESRVSLCRPLLPLWVTSWKQIRSLASCIMHHLALTFPHWSLWHVSMIQIMSQILVLRHTCVRYAMLLIQLLVWIPPVRLFVPPYSGILYQDACPDDTLIAGHSGSLHLLEQKQVREANNKLREFSLALAELV